MGYKQYKACAVIGAFALLLTPMVVRADTSAQLYQMYGVEYRSDVPENVQSTILRYQEAQKLLKQYRYMGARMENQDTDEIGRLRNELSQLAVQLRNGFYLSVDELESLESVYAETLQRYNTLVTRSNSFSIESPISDDFEIPSDSEYEEALRIHAEYTTKENIGDLANIKPFSQAYLVDDFTDTTVTYLTSIGTPTLSLFNGEVSEASEASTVLNCYNGIEVIYSGVNPALEQGSTVYQGKVIGYSSGKVTIQLKLSGDFVSIYDLLEGNHENNKNIR